MQNILDRIMDSKVKTRILRILCKQSAGHTGRQLARELDISPTTASKFLSELAREGIVIMSAAGRAYLYRVNDKNYAVKNILAPFFQKEKSAFDGLVTSIKKNLSKRAGNIESAVIFGSIARKEGNAASDVDLLVVVKGVKDKEKIESIVSGLSSNVAQNFQTVVSPYVLTVEQFRKKHKEKSPLIKEIISSYLLILGKSPERLLI